MLLNIDITDYSNIRIDIDYEIYIFFFIILISHYPRIVMENLK